MDLSFIKEPYIWTSKGLVKESELKYEHSWTINADLIRFDECYKDANGEIVKNSVHVYSLKPLETVGALQGKVNG